MPGPFPFPNLRKGPGIEVGEEPVVANRNQFFELLHKFVLGVKLDENLSLASHIDMICNICAIKGIKPFVPVHTLESIYKSLLQPYFDYCSSLWEMCGKLLKYELQRFQNRAARVILGANHGTHSVDLLNICFLGIHLKIDGLEPSQY